MYYVRFNASAMLARRCFLAEERKPRLMCSRSEIDHEHGMTRASSSDYVSERDLTAKGTLLSTLLLQFVENGCQHLDKAYTMIVFSRLEYRGLGI